MSFTQRLSNHFSASRLISLAKIKGASEFVPRDQNGPYVILQHAYDPGDATMRPADFLLGRSGHWLGTHWFFRMPVPERRREFLFGTLAEVMQLMESLTSEVRVIRAKPDSATDEEPPEDEMRRIIEDR